MKDGDRKDIDELRGALARGYCTKRNENKVLDPYLIDDMVTEVHAYEKQKIGEIIFKPKDRLLMKSVFKALGIGE